MITVNIYWWQIVAVLFIVPTIYVLLFRKGIYDFINSVVVVLICWIVAILIVIGRFAFF